MKFLFLALISTQVFAGNSALNFSSLGVGGSGSSFTTHEIYLNGHAGFGSTNTKVVIRLPQMKLHS